MIVDFEHSYYCQGKAPGLVLCSKSSCGGQKEAKHKTLHKQIKESNVFKLLCSVALAHKNGGSSSLNTTEQVKNLTLATWSSLFPRSCPPPHLSSSQCVLEILTPYCLLMHPLGCIGFGQKAWLLPPLCQHELWTLKQVSKSLGLLGLLSLNVSTGPSSFNNFNTYFFLICCEPGSWGIALTWFVSLLLGMGPVWLRMP